MSILGAVHDLAVTTGQVSVIDYDGPPTSDVGGNPDLTGCERVRQALDIDGGEA